MFKDIDLVKWCLYLFGVMFIMVGWIFVNVFIKLMVVLDDIFLFDYSLFFILILVDYEVFSFDKIVLNDLYCVVKK